MLSCKLNVPALIIITLSVSSLVSLSQALISYQPVTLRPHHDPVTFVVFLCVLKYFL